MKLGSFAEGIKPDKGANDKHNYGIRKKDPVENNETNGDVVPLDDCSEGQSTSDQECNTHGKSS